jgi:hypothetical protein
MSSGSDSVLCFEILSSVDVKDLLVVNVHNVLPVVLEDVPPEAVSCGHNHILATTIALDNKSLVVGSTLDTSCCLVEIPFLVNSAIWSLDDWLVGEVLQISSGGEL